VIDRDRDWKHNAADMDRNNLLHAARIGWDEQGESAYILISWTAIGWEKIE